MKKRIDLDLDTERTGDLSNCCLDGDTADEAAGEQSAPKDRDTEV